MSIVLLQVQDSLPKEVLEGAGVLSLEDALREAHFPANQNFHGKSRLVFEEMFLYHIGKRLNSNFASSSGASNRIRHQGLARLSWIQNIELSDEQEVVLSEMRREMLSPEPMRRLLQGDVGSGKPMVAMFAVLSLFGRENKKGKSAKQPLAIYLCDDELSAERRFLFMEQAFKMLGIQCKILTDKPNKAECNILETEGGIVFCTNELLETRLQSLPNIRMLIVEENSDFGSHIPYSFLKRTPSPDLLVITPTPQSVSVLETVYADFALSTIESSTAQLPTCTWVKATEREGVYEQLLLKVKEGRQGLIVWPVIDGKDLLDIQQALQMAGAIQTHLLPGVRIGIYCSEMKKSERLQVFEEFRHKRIDVLLCATVIEDTPAVENSTMMIVEKAEMTDVMRLHRLRGHLVNSHYAAQCTYIVSEEASEETMELVELVCQEQDGFALVEQVHPQTENVLNLKWAGAEDRDVRLNARNMAHSLSIKDIKRCRWPLLNNAVRNWWSDFSVPTSRPQNKRRYKRKR
jgi:ATP-dependent DNA helicase RecG